MATGTFRARAMLIESSADSATFLRTQLHKMGVEIVEWSRQGTGWVANWQKAQPDIVFVDAQLAKRDGFFCLEKILEMDPHAFVLFTHSYSGLVANDVEVRALDLGAIGVFQKPIAESRLAVSLNRALRQIERQNRIRKVMTKFTI